MALLDLIDKSLLAVDLLDQLVLEVDHAPLELLQLEAVLALDFLLGDVEDLGEVALYYLNVLALLPNHSL